MKQSSLMFIILFVALNLSAQKKIDTLRKVQDTTVSKNLYLIMPVQEWNKLIQLLRTADEKPSLLSQYINLILNNLKEVPNAKKD